MNERIREIIEKENLTNAEFAKRVGIQPSNVSHFLSNRSEPSSEVLQKICRAFPDIDPRWLLLGLGSMYYSEQRAASIKQPVYPTSLFPDLEENNNIAIENTPEQRSVEEPTQEKIVTTGSSNSPDLKKDNESISVQEKLPVRELRKIIVFYSDGTYEEVVK